MHRRSRREFIKTAAAGGVAAALTFAPTSGRAFAQPGRAVAVFGAGPAGLTVAHELAERGFSVTVFEKLGDFGGKTRSIYSPDGLPGEHGFRSTFGFYHNLPDTLRRIPFPGNSHGVWENLVRLNAAMIAGMNRHNLTVPLPFPLPFSQFPMTPKGFIDSVASVFETLFRLPLYEAVFAAERLAVYVSSCGERKLGQWERMTWTDFARLDASSAEYNRFLGDGFIRELVATKSANCSAHSIGLVGEEYVWSLLNLDNDSDGKGNDRVLNGPTSETWINPWVDYLRSIGVTFHQGYQLTGFATDGAHLTSATVTDANGGRQTVEADYYVSAIPLDKVSRVLSEEMTAADPKLDRIRNLEAAWMVGIQFFLTQRVDLANGHVGYNDAPWGLTSISEAQFWRRPVSSYGDGTAREVLSAIISEWDEPGTFNGKTAKQCAPEEIARETWAQIKAHVNDDGEIQLTDEVLHSWMIDPALSNAGTPEIDYDDPIFVQNPGSWYDRPDAWTGIDNLFLAGDWIKTQMNVACMEGANEGGRLAANAVLHASGSGQAEATITPRFTMPLWEPLKLVDRELYKAGQPNMFDVIDRRYPVR
ncbi:hydroxysqualene dehydroxylase [Nocardia inohanensis]|uniref:hydroxysqualene dehydroxylase n=1 Tax=Nocardia inohanensis TaxID=209246 RepID=UPI000837A327|nr:FAD-dependent oxidoreductase [Nocardia inohanensis]